MLCRDSDFVEFLEREDHLSQDPVKPLPTLKLSSYCACIMKSHMHVILPAARVENDDLVSLRL